MNRLEIKDNAGRVMVSFDIKEIFRKPFPEGTPNVFICFDEARPNYRVGIDKQDAQQLIKFLTEFVNQ